MREIADEVGVSKQTVRNEVYRQGLRKDLKETAKGFAVDEEQEALIIAAIKARQTAKASQPLPKTLPQKQEISFAVDLQKELDAKNSQIAAQQAQIERLQQENAELIKNHAATVAELTAALDNVSASLKAAQALHAGTIRERISQDSPEASQKAQEGAYAAEVKDKAAAGQQGSESPKKRRRWWEFWK